MRVTYTIDADSGESSIHFDGVQRSKLVETMYDWIDRLNTEFVADELFAAEDAAEHLTPRLAPTLHEQQIKIPPLSSQHTTPIAALQLREHGMVGARIANKLDRLGIATVEQVEVMPDTELLKVNNFGTKLVATLRERIGDYRTTKGV